MRYLQHYRTCQKCKIEYLYYTEPPPENVKELDLPLGCDPEYCPECVDWKEEQKPDPVPVEEYTPEPTFIEGHPATEGQGYEGDPVDHKVDSPPKKKERKR